MTRIQIGRFDSFLRRLFSVKGSNIAPEITPEVLPVVILSGLELANLALKGWKIGMAFGGAAPGVGQFAQVRILNPPDSDTLVHVERVEIVQRPQDVATPYEVSIRVAVDPLIAGGTPTVATLRDTRFDPADPSDIDKLVAQFSTLSAAGIDGQQVWRSGLIAGGVPDNIVVPLNVVLAPGTAINTNCALAQQSMAVMYWWRERLAEPSELRVA